MPGFTDFVGVRYPEENVDFIRSSVDIKAAYLAFDAEFLKQADPIRGSMRATSDVSRNTATLFKVGFGSSDYNHGGIVDLSNNRFVIPIPDFYRISAQVRWTNGTTGTARKAQLRINDSIVKLDCVDEPSNNGDGGATNTIYYEADLMAGDVVELYARHDNGSPLNPGVETNFGGTWLKISRASFVNG